MWREERLRAKFGWWLFDVRLDAARLCDLESQQHATEIRRLHLRPLLLHSRGMAGMVCVDYGRDSILTRTYEFALHIGVLRSCIILWHKQHFRGAARLEPNSHPLGRYATLPRSFLSNGCG
jgi:hypothetical protein